MASNVQHHEIDIRPASSVYATYQRLSYKPWYALAEFVDNSTASYLTHRKALRSTYQAENPKKPNRCRVEINYDQPAGRLTIRDNAYGMEIDDFRRAVVLDQPPGDRSGRNEFGMGLKTAACWFGTRWTVESTQLGSTNLYRATIDVRDLAVTKREKIKYTVRSVRPSDHWTLITIEDVQQPIIGRAHERVREQLRSIYRSDLRTGEIEIWYQGVQLTYEEPELLTEQASNGSSKLWKEEIALEVPWERTGQKLPVRGWVGIRKTMSRRDSGFVLMRRGRVIIGGPDQGYRPIEVCGSPQTHEYGRLVGELHLDGWPVNQAKDGFTWNDGLEDAFVDALEKACREVTRKARTHRVTDPPQPLTRNEIVAAAEPIRQVVQTQPFRDYAEGELSGRSPHTALAQKTEGPNVQENAGEVPTPTTGTERDLGRAVPSSDQATPADTRNDNVIDYFLDMGEERWLLRLNWQEEGQPEQYWMSLQAPRPSRDNEPANAQVVDITLNMAHPFLAPYLHSRASLDVLHRLVFGLALAETIVRTQAGGSRVDPGALRMKMNEVLKYAAQAEREC